MDTAMRDLERIQEVHPGESMAPRMTAVAMAMLGLAAIGGVVWLFGGSQDTEAQVDDPLAALSDKADLARAAAAPRADSEEDETEVDREALSFPGKLIGDTRSDMAVAVAAASAEHDHLDPIGSSNDSAGWQSVDVATAHPALEAEVASGNTEEFVAAYAPPGDAPAAQTQDDYPQDDYGAGDSRADGYNPGEYRNHDSSGDPMLAKAMERAEPAAAEQASRGSEGKFTLQVISYRSSSEAETYAAALRKRGHSSFVVAADVPDRGRYYRVRVGPFETQREAERYRRTFETEERMNTFVVQRRDE